jgi:hypothetical protein
MNALSDGRFIQNFDVRRNNFIEFIAGKFDLRGIDFNINISHYFLKGICITIKYTFILNRINISEFRFFNELFGDAISLIQRDFLFSHFYFELYNLLINIRSFIIFAHTLFFYFLYWINFITYGKK